MSVMVRPPTDGRECVPQPSGLACIQRRSNFPLRIIERRSNTCSMTGLVVIVPVSSRVCAVVEARLAAGDRVPSEHGAVEHVLRLSACPDLEEHPGGPEPDR